MRRRCRRRRGMGEGQRRDGGEGGHSKRIAERAQHFNRERGAKGPPTVMHFGPKLCRALESPAQPCEKHPHAIMYYPSFAIRDFEGFDKFLVVAVAEPGSPDSRFDLPYPGGVFTPEAS
eukprot:3995301-Pyramimonas_sp.AAC.1